MYDYYYKQWGTFNGIPSVSSTLYEDLHTFINAQGQALQETPGIYLDGSNPTLMAFKTGWINPTGVQNYQRLYNLFLLGQYASPHKWTLGIAYDYDSNVVQTETITPDNNAGTWGSDATWGAGSYWGGKTQVEQWQINAVRQQCQSFQISFNEYFDSSLGLPAGAGLSLSSMNMIIGVKKSYPRNIPATHKA